MFSKRYFKNHLHLYMVQLSEPKIWSRVTHRWLEKANYVTSFSRLLAMCDEQLPECFSQKSEDSKVKEPTSPSAEADLGSAVLIVAITVWLLPSGEEFTNQTEIFDMQLAEKCPKELLGMKSDWFRDRNEHTLSGSGRSEVPNLPCFTGT